MEAIGAAASILTFVGAALQSTKSIYEVVSTIRGAPQNIKLVSQAVNSLHDVLTRFQSVLAASQLPYDTAILGPWQTFLKDVAENVLVFEKKLKRWAAAAEKGSSLRMKIVLFLQDKEIQQLWAIVASYEAGIQSRILDHQTSILTTSTERLRTMDVTMDRTLQTQSTTMQLVEAQGSALGKFIDNTRDANDDLSSKFESMSGRVNDTLDTLHSVASRAQHGSSQLDTILQMLGGIQDQVSQIKDGQVSQLGTSTKYDNPRQTNALTVDQNLVELQGTVRRLSHLAHAESRILDYEDEYALQSLTDDLTSLVQAALVEVETGSNQSTTDNQKRDLKRISGFIASSGSLTINSSGKYSPPDYDISEAINEHNTYKYSLPLGDLSISIYRRKQRKEASRSNCLKSPFELFQASITFMSKLGDVKLKTVASFVQLKSNARMWAMCPEICVYPRVSNHSRVFEVVREGDIDAMKRLLSSGQASLRDHDEDGNSLLHHAIAQMPVWRPGSQAMSCFLIENNLDINEIGYNSSRSERQTPLEIVSHNFWDLKQKGFIRKLLLQSGADPTIVTEGERSAFRQSIVEGDKAAIWSFLSYGDCSALINEPMGSAQAPALIQICAQVSSLPTENLETWYHALTACIRGGGNVRVFDSNGLTCLHHLMSSDVVFKSRPARKIMQKALVFLIAQGADVHALDDSSRSISAIAYTGTRKGPKWSRRPAFNWPAFVTGDVWDFALAWNGLHVSALRSHFPRLPLFDSKDYTRADFDLMWSGIEHLCPYFNEPGIWFATGDDFAIYTFGERQHSYDLLSDECAVLGASITYESVPWPDSCHLPDEIQLLPKPEVLDQTEHSSGDILAIEGSSWFSYGDNWSPYGIRSYGEPSDGAW